jgi:prolyl-tRNA synthetase
MNTKKRSEGKGITSRADNYSEWYNDIVLRAELADYSPVRGCMVIRPYGFAIWEQLKQTLDGMLKETGHENAAFPLFIPKSFLSREAKHVEGFAKECAVVTHSRLMASDDGVVVDPESELEEPLIVRPTSETIIYSQYAKWIQSYRDLPLLINQWGNVVRWEMRTRLFLRTAEFFWQEGHTAHETEEQALEETLKILEIYRTLVEEHLAVPVLCGVKSESERFPGAVDTYTMEALMQDRRALQMGTSHHLGQNFSKAFDVKFQGRDGKEHHVWQTSWGVSTRLIGAMIMAHSDDNGLVLPPRLAPHQVVVVPIYRKDEEKAQVLGYIENFAADLRKAGVRIKVDDREQYKPGYKFNEWELRGVPLRVEAGPRDVAAGNVVLARRDLGSKEVLSASDLTAKVPALLDEIQSSLLQRAKEFREANTCRANSLDELLAAIEEKGGFVLAPWDGDTEVEELVKEKCKATVRVIREQDGGEKAKSIGSDRETDQWAVFAKAY